MKIVVTGGCGFIGSHIVDELVSQQHEVYVIDNLSAINNNFHFNPLCKEYYNEDISNYNIIVSLLKNIDAVFHLAAESNINVCNNNPTLATKTNVQGTSVLLQAAKENKVKRFIYSSTSAAYGLNSPPHTETLPNDCLNLYSATKAFGEELCKLYYRQYNLQTVIFRYFNVYGDRQHTTGQYAPVTSIFLKQRDKNEKLTIVGDGKQKRDFVYVMDIVKANLLALHTNNKECFGRIINIGSGKNYSIQEIADYISNNQIYIPARIGEVRESLADISLANSLLNYYPSGDFFAWVEKVSKFLP